MVLNTPRCISLYQILRRKTVTRLQTLNIWSLRTKQVTNNHYAIVILLHTHKGNALNSKWNFNNIVQYKLIQFPNKIQLITTSRAPSSLIHPVSSK